jgi:TPR repeat protein
MGGCYEAGKIYFLDPARRNYDMAKDRMTRVCDSDDAGIGPYACKYLGIIFRNGLTAKPQIDLAFRPLSRSCFLHNAEPFIDGNGCEILAESLPTADDMGLPEAAWQRNYIAYLAYVMGCTDDMPALCAKARNIYRQAVAASASWPARCVEELERSSFPGACDALANPGMSATFEQRQKLRRTLVLMFRTATENPPLG